LLLSAGLLLIWIKQRLCLLQKCCAAIDQYCTPAGPPAANLPHAVEQDETDGQTLYRYIDSAAYYSRTSVGIKEGWKQLMRLHPENGC